MTDLQVHYFLEVARELNFTAAAKHCFISQPSLSRAIHQLEQELGAELFTRNNRNVQLTPAGEYIRGEFEAMLEHRERIIHQAGLLNRSQWGTLNFVVQEILWTDPVVADIIHRFSAAEPDVTCTITVLDYEAMQQRLQSGEGDVIFSKQFNYFTAQNYSIQKIMNFNAALLVNRANPISSASSLTLKDLKDQQFIVLEQSTARFSYTSLIRACQKEGFFPNVSRFVNSNPARLMCVQQNWGVTLIDMETQMPTSMEDLVRIPVYSDWLEPIGMYAVSMRYPRNPLVQNFFDFLSSWEMQ